MKRLGAYLGAFLCQLIRVWRLNSKHLNVL
jgi:hypothetical protein